MAALEIWHCFYGSIGRETRQRALDALLTMGVIGEEWNASTVKGGGVVFFNEITPELCQMLRDASRGGLQRVLAVAMSRDILTKGASWMLLNSSASDVLVWDNSKLSIEQIASRFERWQQIDSILSSPLMKNNLVGGSLAWIRVLRHVVEIARFTDTSVLVTGESGTGKELVARLIHSLDSRPNKRDLVVADCTTIVPELSGSEFFGHERGAFTGAVTSRDGAFGLANGGSLFLDEVGELPLRLQAELLRIVQEHTYKRVGSNNWQQTDFRLICATNRDLIEEQKLGHFRSDFYYRISGWNCHLPPLRERQEDILPLAYSFLEQLCPDGSPEFDDTVREYLVMRQYPGNVRDLKHLVTRLVHHHVGNGPITVGDIPESEWPSGEFEIGDWRDDGFNCAIHQAVLAGIGLKEIGRAAEDAAERIAIEEEQGNLQRAASRLGVTDRALQIRRAARRQKGFARNARHPYSFQEKEISPGRNEEHKER